MSRPKGLTENIWSSMSEDRKIVWRFLSGIIAVIGVLLVASSGNEYFDWFIKLLTTIFLLAVINTQRSYSKISRKLRKFSTRVAIILGTWGIAVVLSAFFLQKAIVAFLSVFVQEFSSMQEQGISQATQIIVIFSFLLAIPLVTIHLYKSLNLRELIFILPRTELVKMLVRREPKVETCRQFALFELGVILSCLVYFSSVAVLARFFIDLVESLTSLI